MNPGYAWFLMANCNSIAIQNQCVAIGLQALQQQSPNYMTSITLPIPLAPILLALKAIRYGVFSATAPPERKKEHPSVLSLSRGLSGFSAAHC